MNDKKENIPKIKYFYRNNYNIYTNNINFIRLFILLVTICITNIQKSLCSVVPYSLNQNPFTTNLNNIKNFYSNPHKNVGFKILNQKKFTVSPYGYTLNKNLSVSDDSGNLMEILPDTNDLGFFINLNIGNPVYQTTIFLDFFNYYSYIFTNEMKNPDFNFCYADFKFFDTTASSTYELDKNKNFPSKIFVRDFNLTGQSALDTIIFSTDSGKDIQMDDFSFYSINKAEMKYNSSLCFGGSQYFGGIGLGFTNLEGYGFLEQMKNKNLIQEKIFAILLPLQSEKTILHLGGFKKEFVNDTNDINWVNINFPPNSNPKKSLNKSLKTLFDNNDYRFNNIFSNKNENDYDNYNRINWFLQSSKIYMNGILYNEQAKIFTDSLSPYITVPKSFFFDNFKNFFSDETDCKMEQDGLFYCKCHPDINKDYPSFYFEFDGKYNLTIFPRDYLEIIINYNSEDVRACRLLMKLNYDNNFWGIGKFVMNNYYMIFNQEENKLGFYDRTKINQIDSDKALILIMIVSMASFVILAIVYCCIRKIIDRRNSNSNNQALLGI